MASFSRHGRRAFNFSRNLSAPIRQTKCSISSVANLNKTSKSSMKILLGNDSQLLKAARKHLNKTEMRQLQRSAAVLSLTSKVSTCLGLVTTGESDVLEACEDSDDVCSQPGHKLRKRR
ncbi:uncharacterized protein LOC130625819 isoform X2 [Hydractinia symbiolongicarpus]|nr:uncharacterized protein LOC130625819 isoform X2 [Hydractinia symbiolongicarpus]